jgi:hemerythrin
MAITQWKDEYIINVEEIDIQHQTMVKLVNNLHSSVEARIVYTVNIILNTLRPKIS